VCSERVAQLTFQLPKTSSGQLTGRMDTDGGRITPVEIGIPSSFPSTRDAIRPARINRTRLFRWQHAVVLAIVAEHPPLDRR
jgi:hypothetical protein